MTLLWTKTLTAMTASISIGASHRDLLQEKLAEFQGTLGIRKRDLEEEYRTVLSESDRGTQGGPEGAVGEDITETLRQTQQQELDVLQDLFQDRLDQLYQRFQREWEGDPRDKVSTMPLPAAGGEATYLSKELGEALARALAEICERRPHDPIEYLACWLRKYAENCERERQKAVLDLKVKLQREEHVMIEDKTAMIVRERQRLRQEEGRRRDLYAQNVNRVVDVESPQQPDVDVKSTADVGSDVDDVAPSEGSPVTAPKRVTLVDPDTPGALYTIEEKESETVPPGPGEGE